MGLLDVLNGMRNGPGGQRRRFQLQQQRDVADHHGDPGAACLQGHQAPWRQPAAAPRRAAIPAASGQQSDEHQRANGGGGLGDILGGLLGGRAALRRALGARAAAGWADCFPGGLGGLLAGGAAGSILSGGLGGLLNQFQQNGQGEVANSWVSRGPNQNISESDLARSIGSDDIDVLSQHTGLSRDELLSGLSRELPGAIDELTPDGRVPTADEASRWV